MRISKKINFIILAVFAVLVAVFFFSVFQEHPDSWADNTSDKIPIVYSDNYNISLFGLEDLHAFDSEKYGKVAEYITTNTALRKEQFHAPDKITRQELLSIHTSDYLHSLNDSGVIASVTEVGLLSHVPNFILQQRLLDPMRYAAAGTVLAAELALEQGWAINLSGGYHHAKADSGGGFGFYADVPIAVEKLWQKNQDLKVLLVDLDAHQGNGNEAIFANDPRVFILDIFQENNYPYDHEVKKYIDFSYPVGNIRDKEYLAILRQALPQAIEEADPGIIIYNAGTDIYEKDPIGGMDVTWNGIIKRDELVFEQAQERNIPVAMVLSGGYSRESWQIIGESILNILRNVL